MWLERLQRLFAVYYLPHEIAHFIAIRRWSPDTQLHLSVQREDWTHPYIPALAQVTGSIPSDTHPIIIRIAALAPTILFTLVAIFFVSILEVQIYTNGFYFLMVLFVLSYASPSGIDLHTFFHPHDAIQAGGFGATESSASWVWDGFAFVFGFILGTAILLSPLVELLLW